MSARPNPGGFVISLDFELHWGVRDHRTIDQYRMNLLGAREAVPAMLDLFHRHRIHVTWATVGFLFFQNRHALLSALPEELPHYLDPNFNPYTFADLGDDEQRDPFHFAPSLIRSIQSCEGQEIGTHTFSHFYTLAPGPSLESFRADLRCSKDIAHSFGLTLKSIVFPRNQVSRPHIKICAEEGLIAYRGTDADPLLLAGNSFRGKATRLADAYIRLGPDGCVTPQRDQEYPIVNISQSRFLRPWSASLQTLERLRLQRIVSSMEAAARRGETFHLWWHPHNFGVHLDRNLAFLARILEHYTRLRDETGWPSFTMAEVAENVLRMEQPACKA